MMRNSFTLSGRYIIVLYHSTAKAGKRTIDQKEAEINALKTKYGV